MMLCCFLSPCSCPARPRAAWAGPVPVPGPGSISLFLFMRRNVASEGEGTGVTSAVKTNSLLRQWQLWCPWLSLDSKTKPEPCLGAPLITEEVARGEVEGDGSSWRMDATAFEFVYLSFVNSMFLSTFALLCPLVWLPVYLFVFGLRSSIPQSHCHSHSRAHCRSHSPALACKHSAANWIRFNLFTARTKRGEFCLCNAANNNMKPRFMAPTSTSKDSMDSSIRKRNRFPFGIPGQDFHVFPFLEFMQKQFRFARCCQLPGVGFLITRPNEFCALTCSIPGSIYLAQLLQ